MQALALELLAAVLAVLIIVGIKRVVDWLGDRFGF